MKFDLPQDNSSIIKVFGVGGGGSNAVNHMYKQGIKGVDFIVCNTDQQALDISPVPLKIVLGASLTKGRGAGSLPEVGKNAAIENIEEVKAILGNNTEMVFITAGLGGGTGTGAAPVIAQAAKEMGILTVGIVTIPFGFEGKKRKAQADEGLNALKANVDTLLVISNDKLREIYGNLKVTEAFGHADDILTTAAKGIADIITTTLQINTDINDVKTVMKDSGVAIMGSAQASGEARALRAVEQAMASPLLNDSNIRGARYVLVNVTCGEDEITMDELGEITDYIQDAAGMTAEVIKGYGVDSSLGDKVSVTIIATGFNSNADLGIKIEKAQEKKVFSLLDEQQKAEVITPPVVNETPQVQEMTSFFKEEVVAPVNETPVVNEVEETPIAEEPFMFIKNEAKEETPIAEVEEKKQITFEFEITNNNSNAVSFEEPFIISKSEETVMQNDFVIENKEENKTIAEVQQDEQLKKAQDRIEKLKQLSFKLKSPNGLSELENEPAYKRRNISLDSTPHSSESQVSRYTLSEGDDKKIEIKPNNSFLHDNVD
ncbi:MAG: cell division protein FtsZ [Bacteroidia bacterium]|nr:cell division protein FtsZ [Bacteroidia bacterium]MCK6650223.1 cell division protein FtsZ [Bacteroidia bacterium]